MKLPRPPFPPEVRARLDPQLFVCDRCGAELEYPGVLCSSCRHEERRERRLSQPPRHHNGFRPKPDGGLLIPRAELAEFRALFRIPADRYISTPNFRLDPCAYCGASGPNTLDHIEPYSVVKRSHGWTNAAACCYRCNVLKASLPLFVWLARVHGGALRTGPANRGRRYHELKRWARQWSRYQKRQAVGGRLSTPNNRP